MALIVAPDDGFDSLASVDFSDAYHANLGHPAWAGLQQPAKEAALRQATQYILGRRVLPEFIDPVHVNVKAATAEAALRASAGALYADIDPQAVVSETVGQISTTYAQPGNGGRMRFPVIDDLLRGLTDGAFTVKLVRG